MHARILPILQHEMPLISCIKGDHLIIPGVLDQGATEEHRPMFFFLDERRWMEGIPLNCLQCAPGFSVPAHRCGTTPCHHTQKANIETITKTNTYPWNRHVSFHPRLSAVLPHSWESVWTCVPASTFTFKLTRGLKVCSLSANSNKHCSNWTYLFQNLHTHIVSTLLCSACRSYSFKTCGKVYINRMTKHCN